MGALRNKQQIAVITDLEDDMPYLLKSAVSFAKMISGEVQVLSVKKPTQVIGKGNQLSAMRSINQNYILTDKRLKSIVLPIMEKYSVSINYSSTFGNTKSEIERYLETHKPDILVLGRRKSKPFNTADDRIINFVLNIFEGTVLIVSPNKGLEPGKKIGIGSLNCSEAAFATSFTKDLFFNTNSSLKSFNLLETSDVKQAVGNVLGRKTINYVFDHSENTVKKLPDYLSKSKIDLLFMERRRREKISLSKSFSTYDIVRKSDINLLIIGKSQTYYNYNTNLKIA